MRVFFHVLFSPMYIAAGFLFLALIASVLFFEWLFPNDGPISKDEYYGRFL